jgi:hypothetical protein
MSMAALVLNRRGARLMANYRAFAAASATSGAAQGPLSERRFRRTAQRRALPGEGFLLTDEEGIAICLWRVAPNISRRSLGPRTDIYGRRFKASLPLDLYYLLVPSPRIPSAAAAARLDAARDARSGLLVASELTISSPRATSSPKRGARHGQRPLSVADQLTLWDRTSNMPPAATYVMRMLLLDSELDLDEYPIVVERDDRSWRAAMSAVRILDRSSARRRSACVPRRRDRLPVGDGLRVTVSSSAIRRDARRARRQRQRRVVRAPFPGLLRRGAGRPKTGRR